MDEKELKEILEKLSNYCNETKCENCKIGDLCIELDSCIADKLEYCV